MRKIFKNIISFLPTLFVIFAIIFSVVKYCEEIKLYEIHENCLDVFYLDVGQGDSIYISLPNGEDMLIDAGEDDADSYITMDKLNIDDIEYLVMTHPHTDHIGGIMDILEEFEVESVLMPDSDYGTMTYNRILEEIERQNIPVIKAVAGKTLLDTEDLDIEILSPDGKKQKDVNNLSVMLKITYKNNEFLFTGDIENNSELKVKGNVEADVLKVAHHGSNTSTCQEFLDKVNPEYAVISVGEYNDYGHPHFEVIDRLKKKDIKILRTDRNGTIHLCSDGEIIKINAQNLD